MTVHTEYSLPVLFVVVQPTQCLGALHHQRRRNLVLRGTWYCVPRGALLCWAGIFADEGDFSITFNGLNRQRISYTPNGSNNEITGGQFRGK